jgi:hypothetical protein
MSPQDAAALVAELRKLVDQGKQVEALLLSTRLRLASLVHQVDMLAREASRQLEHS